MRLFTGFRSQALLDDSSGSGAASAQSGLSHDDPSQDDHFPATVSDDWSYNDQSAPADSALIHSSATQHGRAMWVPYGPSSLVSLEDEIAALEQHTRARQQYKQDVLHEQQQLQQDINAVCQRIKELRQLHYRVRDDEAHEVAALDTLQARISSLEQARHELHSLHADALNNQHTVQAELEQLRTRHESLRTEHNDLEASIARFVALKETRCSESRQLAQDIRAQEKELVLQRQQLLQITQEQQHLQERVRAREAEVGALHAHRKQLRYQAYVLRSHTTEEELIEPNLPSKNVDRLVARYSLPPSSYDSTERMPARGGLGHRLLWISLVGAVLVLVSLMVFWR